MGEAQSNTESEGEEDEDDEGFLGDSGESEDEMSELIRDCFPYSHFLHWSHGRIGSLSYGEEEPNKDAKKFFRLLRELEEQIYESSRCSKLSTKLLHIKTRGRWNNESFSMLLKFLKEELLPAKS